MVTPQEMAERMKAEILADIAAGVVPPTVRTYSELHSYVDANCYGGSEALLDELDASFPQTDEGGRQALDMLCDIMNPAMDIVNEWMETAPWNRDGEVNRCNEGVSDVS